VARAPWRIARADLSGTRRKAGIIRQGYAASPRPDVQRGVGDSGLILCRANADCSIGFDRGVAVAFWRYHTYAEDVLALEAAVLRAHQACGHRIGLIQIVSATAIVPDQHARAALAGFLRRSNRIVARSALVHEAQGFRAAMIRSIVTGITALSNPGFPHRVYGSLPDALDELCRPGSDLAASDVRDLVAKLRVASPTEPPAGARRNERREGEQRAER
jgi:hypothetical protein